MGTAAAIEIGIAVVGAAASAKASADASAAQEQQLMLRKRQEKLKAAQGTIEESDKLRVVLAKQRALASVRGISAASGSVKSLSNLSFKAFDEDEKNRALNLSFIDSALDAQIRAEEQKSEAGFFGSLSDVGFNLAQSGVFSKKK